MLLVSCLHISAKSMVMKIYPCFLLRAFILYYSLCMVWGKGLNSLFFVWTSTCSTLLIEKPVFCFLCVFFCLLKYIFIKSQLPINVNVYFQIYNLLHWSSPLFLCKDPLDYYSFVASFKIICMIFSKCVFQYCLSCSGSLTFPYKF